MERFLVHAQLKQGIAFRGLQQLQLARQKRVEVVGSVLLRFVREARLPLGVALLAVIGLRFFPVIFFVARGPGTLAAPRSAAAGPVTA